MAAKTVLIVGSKQGIGLELGKKFKARGYEIYGTIRSFAKDEGQLGPLNEIASGVFEVDIQDEKMIEAAAKAWGDKPLDILVNSAGKTFSPADDNAYTDLIQGLGPNPFDWKDHTAEDLQSKFQVNVVGPFLTMKHFYPALERSRQGKIINISSNMASMSSLVENRRGRSLGYRLSKAAVNQLTVSLGREFQSHDSNVTVNSIHPGWIPTAVSGFTGPDSMDVQTGLMIDTIENMGPEDIAQYLNAKGEDMPW